MGKITKTVKCTACEKVYRGQNAVRVLSAHKRLKHESVIRGVQETSLKRREPPCPADVVPDPIPGPSSSVSRPRYADSSASMIDQNESARGTFLPVAETDIFAHPVRMEEGPSVLSAIDSSVDLCTPAAEEERDANETIEFDPVNLDRDMSSEGIRLDDVVHYPPPPVSPASSVGSPIPYIPEGSIIVPDGCIRFMGIWLSTPHGGSNYNSFRDAVWERFPTCPEQAIEELYLGYYREGLQQIGEIRPRVVLPVPVRRRPLPPVAPAPMVLGPPVAPAPMVLGPPVAPAPVVLGPTIVIDD